MRPGVVFVSPRCYDVDMTKKHFEALAHTLDANMAPLSLVLDMADTCAEFNPHFARATFIKAATKNLRAQHEYEVRVLDLAGAM